MYTVENLLDNLSDIYNQNTSFSILKDFERVLDEFFDIYVFDNWEHGEIVKGPIISKYWVTCYFMWDDDKRPDLSVLERFKSNNCMSKTGTSYFIEPIRILKPEDIRPGTKKGKLKRKKVFVIGIKVPKTLLKNVYAGQDIFKKAEAEAAEQGLAPNAPAEDMGLGQPPVTDAAMGAPSVPGVI